MKSFLYPFDTILELFIRNKIRINKKSYSYENQNSLLLGFESKS